MWILTEDRGEPLNCSFSPFITRLLRSCKRWIKASLLPLYAYPPSLQSALSCEWLRCLYFLMWFDNECCCAAPSFWMTGDREACWWGMLNMASRAVKAQCWAYFNDCYWRKRCAREVMKRTLEVKVEWQCYSCKNRDYTKVGYSIRANTQRTKPRLIREGTLGSLQAVSWLQTH